MAGLIFGTSYMSNTKITESAQVLDCLNNGRIDSHLYLMAMYHSKHSNRIHLNVEGRSLLWIAKESPLIQAHNSASSALTWVQLPTCQENNGPYFDPRYHTSTGLSTCDIGAIQIELYTTILRCIPVRCNFWRWNPARGCQLYHMIGSSSLCKGECYSLA